MKQKSWNAWRRTTQLVSSWYVMAGCVLLLVCSCLILPPQGMFGPVAKDLGIRNAPTALFTLDLIAAYRGDRWVVYKGIFPAAEDVGSERQLAEVYVICFARGWSFWDVAFEDLTVVATRIDLRPGVKAELRQFDHGEELVEAVARACEQRDSRLGAAIRSSPMAASVIRWRGLLNNIAASMLVLVLAAGMVTRVVRLARGGVVGERRRRGLCVGCGYDLVGVGAEVVCPECGEKG